MSDADLFKYDVRVRERMLQAGRVTAEEIKAHMESLPDVAERCEDTITVQPALARPEPEPAAVVPSGAPTLHAAPSPAVFTPAIVGLTDSTGSGGARLNLPGRPASLASVARAPLGVGPARPGAGSPPAGPSPAGAPPPVPPAAPVAAASPAAPVPAFIPPQPPSAAPSSGVSAGTGSPGAPRSLESAAGGDTLAHPAEGLDSGGGLAGPAPVGGLPTPGSPEAARTSPGQNAVTSPQPGDAAAAPRDAASPAPLPTTPGAPTAGDPAQEPEVPAVPGKEEGST